MTSPADISSVFSELNNVHTLHPDVKQSLRETAKQRASGMVSLIGYCEERSGSENVGRKAFAKAVINLWNKGPAKATLKENVPICCVFAARGQGKTELCQQLVCNPMMKDFEPYFSDAICVAVTFNQYSLYSAADKKCGILKAFMKRVWAELQGPSGSNERQRQCPWSDLQQMVDDLRQTVTQQQQQQDQSKPVAVLLAVDEFLKIDVVETEDEIAARNLFLSPQEYTQHLKDTAYSERKLLLDSLAALQQTELCHGMPTFVLVTSLNCKFVMDTFTTASGRLVEPILLPVAGDRTQEALARLAFKDIWEVMTRESIEKPSSSSDRRLSDVLYRLIRMGIGLSGRHFRAMENVLRAIYRTVVSSEAHESACSKEHLILCHHFESADSESVDLMKLPGARHNLMEEALWAAMADIPWNHDKDIFLRALSLFLRLLVDPTLKINEKHEGNLDLEDRGILFVVSRSAVSPAQVTPRICLPFLYRAPRLCPSILPGDGFHVPVNGYIHSKHPQRLQEILPMLVSNIGQAATSSVFDDAAVALEAIIPWAELVRMYATSCWSANLNPYDDQYLPPVDEILTGAVYCPWEKGEILSASTWVFATPFHVNRQLTIPRMEQMTMKSIDVTNRMIQEAQNSFTSSPHAVMGHSRDAKTQTIEYVAHHFERQTNDDERTPVLLLASMQLREAEAVQPELELTRIHNVAKHAGLRDGEYVAAVYCCANASICQTAGRSAPPGSLIVGAECLQELLASFEMSYLIQLVQEKSQKVQLTASCSASAAARAGEG